MDLRKCYMHKMFGMPREVIPPSTSELLMSQQLTDLLNEVKEQFDLVIIDTPPIMAVTYAAIVALP